MIRRLTVLCSLSLFTFLSACSCTQKQTAGASPSPRSKEALSRLEQIDLHVVGSQPRGDGRVPDFHAFYHPPSNITTPGVTIITHDTSIPGPVVEFYAGWGIFTGGYPAARTRRVRAVAVGTSFYIAVRPSNDLVINLASSNNDVELASLRGQTHNRTLNPGDYGLIDDSGAITHGLLSAAPADITAAAAEAENFLLTN